MLCYSKEPRRQTSIGQQEGYYRSTCHIEVLNAAHAGKVLLSNLRFPVLAHTAELEEYALGEQYALHPARSTHTMLLLRRLQERLG